MWIAELWRRLRVLLDRDRFERDLQEEMRIHLEFLASEHADRDAARRRFGNSTRLREESREIWNIGGSLWRDVRYGLRSLAKARSFTALAVFTLALGIGASTAVFSLVDAVLIKPLPYPHPDRVMIPWRLPPPRSDLGLDELPWGILDLRVFERTATLFEHIGAFKSDSFNLTGMGEPELLEGIRASAGFFRALGVEPALGRFYTNEEDSPGREREAILSDRLWRSRFAADPNILGRAVELNGFSYAVIGVMPPGFAFPRAAEMPGSFNFPREPQLWVPLALTPMPYPTQPSDLAVIGRVRPGVSTAQAQAQMDLCTAELDRRMPQAKGWFRGRVVSLEHQVAGGTRRPLLLMLIAVSVVLLIACSNVANLLLIRSLGRSREFSLRAALGAGRARLVGQLLTESLLLAALAGAGGLGIAAAGLDFAKRFGPPNIPRLAEASLNLDVFLFAFAASLLTGILFGFAPAIEASRHTLIETLKDGARGSSGSRSRLRSGLLIFQVALALVLAVASGLLTRSFRELVRVDPGFNPHSVLSFTLSLPSSRYSETSSITALFDTLLRHLRAVPGVESAGIGETVPMGGTGESTVVRIVEHAGDDPKQRPDAVYTIASPGYFAAVGTPLLRGRLLAESDTAETKPVTVISKSLAERFFVGENPIGKHLALGSPRFPPMEIVGIVADVKHLSLREGPAPEMYVPYTQKPYPSMLVMRVVVRTSAGPRAAAGYIREAVHASDRDLPVAELATLSSIVDQSLTQPRFAMLLVAGFGALAVALAAIGMYGVISYSVTRRTQEIGIRMALGAARSDVLRMILIQGARFAAAGITLGIAASFLVTPLIAAFLYGIRPADPVTFAGVSLLLAAVALLACYIPARRATRLDPTLALRHE